MPSRSDVKNSDFALAFFGVPGKIFPFMESTVMMAKMFEALNWLKANLKNVIIGAVIVIVVGTSVSMFLYNRAQREVHASEALSEVQTPNSMVAAPLPGQAEAYLKVAKEYPGTKSAARALLEAAGVYFVQGKYAESEKIFQRELREYPESPWRSQATLGIAATLEQQGKTNEAIAKYEEVRRNPTAPEVDDAKLSLARLYEGQGKRVEALKMYDELLRAYPYGGLGMEAGIRLEDLTNRYPSLATNLVPVIPPNMQTMLMTNRPTNRLMTLTNLPPRMRTNLMNLTNASKAPRPTLMVTNPLVPQTETKAPATPPASVPNPAPKAPAGTNATK